MRLVCCRPDNDTRELWIARLGSAERMRTIQSDDAATHSSDSAAVGAATHGQPGGAAPVPCGGTDGNLGVGLQRSATIQSCSDANGSSTATFRCRLRVMSVDRGAVRARLDVGSTPERGRSSGG